MLPKLANPPRPGAGYQHQGKSATGIVFTWADPDPMVLPTRHVFVGFILALLETGDKSLVRPVLAQKALLGNVLRHLGADPAELATRTLRVLKNGVLAPGSGVPSRLQARPFAHSVPGHVILLLHRSLIMYLYTLSSSSSSSSSSSFTRPPRSSLGWRALGGGGAVRRHHAGAAGVHQRRHRGRGARRAHAAAR